MRWAEIRELGPIRDAHGLIVLEEADDDAQTATFRVYGRRSVTFDGRRFDGDPPPALRRALAPQQFGRFVAAGRRP